VGGAGGVWLSSGFGGNLPALLLLNDCMHYTKRAATDIATVVE
jgi:hypothetical protein